MKYNLRNITELGSPHLCWVSVAPPTELKPIHQKESKLTWSIQRWEEREMGADALRRRNRPGALAICRRAK